jgi:membrane associated rhomboid family serine protease
MIFTAIIVVINVLFYISALQVGGELNQLNSYGVSRTLVFQNQEYWRLITATFIQGSFISLLFSCIAGGSWISTIENTIGTIKTSFVYFLTGALGFITSLILHNVLIGGSSTAISGIIGLYFCMKYKEAGSFGRMMDDNVTQTNIFYNLGFTLVGAILGADIISTITATLFGFILGFFIKPRSERISTYRGLKRYEVPPENTVVRHRCYVCNKTDISNKELEFRYCSKCSNDECYCNDHIYTHNHK